MNSPKAKKFLFGFEIRDGMIQLHELIDLIQNNSK